MRKISLLFYIILLQVKLFAQISNEQVYKFNRVMDLVSMFYVDSIQEDKLVEKAIIASLKELDPHSTYISKDEVRELNEPLLGSFDGIGITYHILHDTVYIISTFEGGPSERMGLKPGDRIIAIDNNQIAGIGIKPDAVRNFLLGTKGTFVSLKVKPNGRARIESYDIPREQIPIHSIDASYQVNSTTGYIRLNRFSANSLEEFTNAAKKLRKSGVEDLILDLRDNGGGYLKVATDLTDQFLSDDKLIVYTEGISSPKSEYFANARGLFERGKLVILINEGTASASEILSGAIQDWDKGLLVGRRSFGKGLVQRPFSLMDGSLIRLTIARYYTPSGRLIQKPYKLGFENYTGDLKERLNHGEFFHADSIHFPDSLKFQTLLNKRTVYGGGGIMPDIFVPLDTTSYPAFYQNMMRSGKLSEFVLDYIDKNRSYLSFYYPKFDTFKHKFEPGDPLINRLIQFAINQTNPNSVNAELLADQANSIPHYPNENMANQVNHAVKNHLKAVIAQNLFGNGEYYEILNNTDKVFIKALEIINNPDQYYSLLSSN